MDPGLRRNELFESFSRGSIDSVLSVCSVVKKEMPRTMRELRLLGEKLILLPADGGFIHQPAPGNRKGSHSLEI